MEENKNCLLEDQENDTPVAGETEPADIADEAYENTISEQKELDAADEEWGAPEETLSQAALDLKEAGMEPEFMAEESQKNLKKEKRKGEKLATMARFRWVLLLALSFASVAAWTVEAFLGDRPYKWLSIGFLLLTGLLTFIGFINQKFIKMPTRSGMAALVCAITLLLSTLHGPYEKVFENVPAALLWGGLLTLVTLWVGVAIWRKLGRYKIIDILLSIVVIYAALGPVLAWILSIVSGYAIDLSFHKLFAHPQFLTNRLPWALWPSTLVLFFTMPLAAFFAFWDQISIFKRIPAARHGGNFFLALAFLLLIPCGFVHFGVAVEAAQEQKILPAGMVAEPGQERKILPDWLNDLRSTYNTNVSTDDAKNSNQPKAPGSAQKPQTGKSEPSVIQGGPPKAGLIEIPQPEPLQTQPDSLADFPESTTMDPATTGRKNITEAIIDPQDTDPEVGVEGTQQPETAAPIIAQNKPLVGQNDLEGLEERLNRAELKLQTTESRIQNLETQIQSLAERLNQLEPQPATTEASKLEELEKRMQDLLDKADRLIDQAPAPASPAEPSANESQASPPSEEAAKPQESAKPEKSAEPQKPTEPRESSEPPDSHNFMESPRRYEQTMLLGPYIGI